MPECKCGHSIDVHYMNLGKCWHVGCGCQEYNGQPKEVPPVVVEGRGKENA